MKYDLFTVFSDRKRGKIILKRTRGTGINALSASDTFGAVGIFTGIDIHFAGSFTLAAAYAFFFVKSNLKH